MQSAQSTVRQSQNFPANYGDFRFISSDGVIFNFPRFLLSHVSPVFKDKLERRNKNTSPESELRVTEDSFTLDQFLRFFDPNKKKLPLDMETMVRLLEAAGKYRVEQGFEYWEENMNIRHPQQVGSIQQPMLCLALGSRFERQLATRLALRDLVKAPTDVIQQSTWIQVDGRMMSHLMLLRRDRVERMLLRLQEFQTGLNAECGKKHQDILKSIFTMLAQLVDEPSWSMLLRNQNLWATCDCGSGKSVLGSKELFFSWREGIMTEEAELPRLPGYFKGGKSPTAPQSCGNN
ncbi:hypothetical protein FRC20_001787 [Serendipita sp. 405]|nr:hypothetical protein FRC20_001787 [Serendipita sp. 405]